MSLPPGERSRESSAAAAAEAAIDNAHAPAPAPAPRRRKAPLTTAMCVLYILGVIGVLMLMRLAGERWWLATLLLFSPRWIWATPLVVALPMALLFRRRMTIPLLLAGAVVLLAVTGFRVPWRNALPAPQAHDTVRLFTCNLHGRMANPLLLEQVMAESPPDVILYQDYHHTREPGLARAPGWHDEQYNGVYIASRFPFHRVADLLPRDDVARQYASHGWPVGDAVCYAIELPDGETIHVINVHLASAHQQLEALRDRDPAGPAALQADSDRRGFESYTVSAAARQVGGPVIIAGDFNTPDDSPLFGAAWDGYDDAFNVAGFGFGTTYANHHTWLRIDHVLYDPSWHCVECRVGPPVGSGHRPIVAVLQR